MSDFFVVACLPVHSQQLYYSFTFEEGGRTQNKALQHKTAEHVALLLSHKQNDNSNMYVDYNKLKCKISW